MIVPKFQLGVGFVTLLLTLLLTLSSFSKPARAIEMSSRSDHSQTDSSKSTFTIVRTPIRQVSGQLKNTSGNPIRSASMQLIAGKDTLTTSVDAHGNFRFANVRSAEFVVQVHAMGYKPFVRKYFMNDVQGRLTLPEIRLEVAPVEMDAVDVSRSGPVVKGDTTEYWAEDYIVREFARLKDLLVQMEGIHIDEEGTLFHNGVEVSKALFNNAQYFDGSVRDAINELPAHIIQRVQIIDGVKEIRDPTALPQDTLEKVLNVVTKRDKSAGSMLRLLSEASDQERFRVGGSLRKLDAAAQTSVRGGHSKLIPGVKSDKVPGTIGDGLAVIARQNAVPSGTQGTFQSTSAGILHNILFKRKVLIPDYEFVNTQSGTHHASSGEEYYSEGTLLIDRAGQITSKENSHELKLEWQPRDRAAAAAQIQLGKGVLFGSNSKSWIRLLKGNILHRAEERSNNTLELRSGLVDAAELNTSLTKDHSLKAGANLNISVPLGGKETLETNFASNLSQTRFTQNTYTGIKAGETWGEATDVLQTYLGLDFAADSALAQRRNGSRRQFYQYMEAAYSKLFLDNKIYARIYLNGNFQHNVEDTRVRTSVDDGSFVRDPNFDRYMNLTSISVPVGVMMSYRINHRLMFGSTLHAQQDWRSGHWRLESDNLNRYDFNLSPSLTVDLQVSQASIHAGYRRATSTSQLEAFSPDTIYRTPFEWEIGNPDLKSSIEQQTWLSMQRSFFKWSASLGGEFIWSVRGVGINRTFHVQPESQTLTSIMQRVNVEGGHTHKFNLSLDRRFATASMRVQYTGRLEDRATPYFADGLLESSSLFQHSHELKFFRNVQTWARINPILSFNSYDNVNTRQQLGDRKIFERRFQAACAFTFFLPQYITMNVQATQSLLRMTNLQVRNDKFVLNANVERRFLKDKSLIASVVVMDLARQNWDVSTNYTELGYSQNLTNPNSRYYLFQLSWQPQFWHASRFDTGQHRRGDGSLL